jgi:hypothetical protein
MPEIIITPGTFAPVGPAVESGVALGFPRTPVQTRRKVAEQYQWSSQPTDEDSEPAGVVSVDRDYTSGLVTVGVSADPFNSLTTGVTASGVRYVPDRLHPVRNFNSFEKLYGFELPEAERFAPSGVLDLGTVIIEYGGDGGLPSNFFWIDFDAAVTVTGDDAPEIYTVDPDLGGGLISATFNHFGTGGDGWAPKELEGSLTLEIKLKIGTEVVDAFVVSVPVRVTCEFQLHADVMVPGSDLPIPEVDSGLTITDALFGKGTNLTPVTPPTVPFDGYRRYGRAPQGTLTPL